MASLSKLPPLENALRFLQNEKVVGREVCETFFYTGRPGNLHTIYLRGTAHAEVEAKIILRVVTRSAHDFIDLAVVAARYFHASANGGPIRARAHAPDHDPVVLVPAIVSQQRWRTVQIVDNDIHIAVVVEVAEGATTAQILHPQRG